jgi:hypothetical protein
MNIPEKIVSCRADLAGLSIFSDLRSRPLLDTFGRLLEAAESAAGADFAMTKSRTLAENVREGMLELCRAWAAFTETFVLCAEAPEESPPEDNSFYGMVASLALDGGSFFARAMERSAKGPVAGANPVLPPVLAAAAASDLDRLGSIAAFDISGLGLYLAGLLRNRGFEKAARHIETEARAFWENEGAAVNAERGGEDKAGIRLFPRNGGWSAALPALAAYVRGRGKKPET